MVHCRMWTSIGGVTCTDVYILNIELNCIVQCLTVVNSISHCSECAVENREIKFMNFVCAKPGQFKIFQNVRAFRITLWAPC